MSSNRSHLIQEYARIVREKNLLKLRLLSIDRRLTGSGGATKSHLEETRLAVLAAIQKLDEEGDGYLALMRKDCPI